MPCHEEFAARGLGRSAAWGISAVWLLAASALAAPPTRYEISINGENFMLESDRIVKLNSVDKPGTSYEVGIRVAQFQPWQLKTSRFNYHNGFTPSEEPQAVGRSVSLKHELGFVMVVSDLGGPLPEENQDKTLQLLTNSMHKTLDAGKVARLEVGKAAVRNLGSTTVRGITIRYDDRDGVGRSSLVYLVTGARFSCSVIVQCLDADRENVLPLVTTTLESFEAVEK